MVIQYFLILKCLPQFSIVHPNQRERSTAILDHHQHSSKLFCAKPQLEFLTFPKISLSGYVMNQESVTLEA